MTFLQNLHPVIQALLATFFTWAMTAIGTGVVFTARDVSKRVLDTRVSPVTVRRKATEQ
jgi:ZIP family zinc transporter